MDDISIIIMMSSSIYVLRRTALRKNFQHEGLGRRRHDTINTALVY